MKTGTNRAILTTELFRSDGPFHSLADDFVAERCSRCSVTSDDEFRFFEKGYYCSTCWAVVIPFSS